MVIACKELEWLSYKNDLVLLIMKDHATCGELTDNRNGMAMKAMWQKAIIINGYMTKMNVR